MVKLFSISTYHCCVLLFECHFRNLHIGGVQHVMWFYLTMKLCDMSVLQFLIIIERYHLFVWTVFAPKLLFEVTILSIYLIFYTLATGKAMKLQFLRCEFKNWLQKENLSLTKWIEENCLYESYINVKNIDKCSILYFSFSFRSRPKLGKIGLDKFKTLLSYEWS